MDSDQDVRMRVDVETPWFKLMVDQISWKEVIVVAMVLFTVVYIMKF